jgi:hypothetical protein
VLTSEERGIDGGKKIKGRKRHIVVDTHIKTSGLIETQTAKTPPLSGQCQLSIAILLGLM